MGPREHNSTLPRIWWESEQDWEDRWEADLLRPDFFAPARPPVRGFVPVPPPRRNRGANRERVIWVVDDGRWTIRAVDDPERLLDGPVILAAPRAAPRTDFVQQLLIANHRHARLLRAIRAAGVAPGEAGVRAEGGQQQQHQSRSLLVRGASWFAETWRRLLRAGLAGLRLMLQDGRIN
jgi:hypothetical protein